MGLFGSKQIDSHNTHALINSSSSTLGKNKPYSNDISQREFQTHSPLTMPIQNTYRCAQCGMVFPTDEALFKHRTRFCIGINDLSIGRKAYYSDDEEINEFNRENYFTNRSTSRRVVKHQSPIEKKREEIYEWKNQRSVLQSVQDMEDKIIRDSQKTQKIADSLKKRTHDYNQILAEYEQLQAEEQDLLRQMFNLQGRSGSHLNRSNGLTDYEQNQLEVLQLKNARLEQERRVLQNKLEELIANNQQSSTVSNYEPYQLLRDMKEEQERNEKALIQLRRRRLYPNSSLVTSSDIPSLPYVNTYRRTAVDDLPALQNGYLQSGGDDINVLSRYSNLERRLRHYEYYPWLKDYPEPLRHYRYRPIETVTDKLISAEYENKRLHNDLFNMERKFERLDSRTRQLELTVATSGIYDHKSNDYRSYPSPRTDRYQPLKSANNTSARQPYSNYDNETFEPPRQYYQPTLPTIDRRILSRGTQPKNVDHSNTNHLRDPLGPQPYDPVGGFVIFFDFIINFPSTIEQCRLITCLHHAQSGLGEPSQLQPSKCELYADATSGERMNIALIAMKQPVPSCPPQQTLSVVIEVQVVTKQAPNEKLRTNAWTKLPLFDHRNRLLSGRWKVPLKSLPIRQDEKFTVINTLPAFGRTELHYRLVNSQDAVNQSNAPLSPTSRDLYFYPPQYRNGSYQ